MVDTRVGGVVREVLVSDTEKANVAGVVREVLLEDTAHQKINVGEVVREILVSGVVVSQVAVLVREILRTPEAPVPPFSIARPWLRDLSLLIQEDEDEAPYLRLLKERLGVQRKKLRPYLLINV